MRRILLTISLFCLASFTANPLELVARAASDPHAYFSELSARAEKFRAFSLRSQAELNTWVHGPDDSDSITYRPDSDTYAFKQDAAKVVVGANKTTIEQVRLPIGVKDGSVLITWDAWWGPEFQTDRGAMDNQKTFQIASPIDVSERWLEVRSRYGLASGTNIARVDARSYAKSCGPLVKTCDQPIAPQANQFTIAPATWTRYWVNVTLNGTGFDTVSMWVADENREPVMIFDNLEINAATSGLTNLWLEYNSSQTRVGGQLVGYLRNVVMLRNVANPTALLRKPLGEGSTDSRVPPAAPKNLRILTE